MSHLWANLWYSHMPMQSSQAHDLSVYVKKTAAASNERSREGSVSHKLSPRSLNFSYSRYAQSYQDQWPEPRIYDEVPYEKVQVRSTA